MRPPVLLAAAAVAAASMASVGAFAATSGKATPVTVTLKEFTLKPSVTTVPAGNVAFTARNVGKIKHEMVIIKTALAPGKLPVSGGEASEKGAVSEIGEFGPGQTRKLTVRLKAGKYALICNVGGHYKLGQYAGLVVK